MKTNKKKLPADASVSRKRRDKEILSASPPTGQKPNRKIKNPSEKDSKNIRPHISEILKVR